MTELIVYKPSVIKNGFFNDYSVFSWTQTGSGTWSFFKGYAEQSGGTVTLKQENVLFKGVKYRIKIKVTDLVGGESVQVSVGNNYSILSDGVYEIDLDATSKDFSILATSGANCKISNISVFEWPGSFSLDVPDDFYIPLTFSIDDIKNPSTRSTSYSKTTTLPGTKSNNKFFNQIYEIGSGSLFNSNKRCDCVVLEDGIQVFKGGMCLDQIERINGSGFGYDDIQYSVTLVGELGTLFNTWADKKLSDLDFSEYNHEFNRDNIFYSWFGRSRINGTLTDVFTETLSYTVSSISSVTFDGQDRVKVTFTGAHGFNIGQEVFGWTNNNLLSGFQTVLDKDSTSITLNLLWIQLTDTSTPTGTFTNYELNGEGYVYPMIDMGELLNSITHDQEEILTGPLIPGKSYIFKKFFSGDDFTNVGAISLFGMQGYCFTATGDTPTDWTNGSILVLANIDVWRTTDFYPALFYREIFYKMFQLIGYTFDAPIIETPIFKRIILPWANGETFQLSTSRKRQIEFRASMQDTVSEPTGHTFEVSYNLYPFPNKVPYNAAPTSFLPVNVDYSATFPANTYLCASHHRIDQSTGNLEVNPQDVVPINNDQPPTDYDEGNRFDVTVYEFESPSGYPSIEYKFEFSGNCWNYIKNPTAYDAITNPTGDLPSDFAGTGAPGIYAAADANGKLIGAMPLNANPAYEERTDIDIKPFNTIIFQKSIDGGSTWVSIKALDATGVNTSTDYSYNYWNGDMVSGDCIVTLNPLDRFRVIYSARARCIALRSDGKPCIGASRGGAAGTGSGTNGTGGPVTMTLRIDNAVFKTSMVFPQIPEGFTYDLNLALPNVKISDFFKSVTKAFNLLVEPDKSDAKHIRITSRNKNPLTEGYYSSDNIIDWTSKLAINMPIVIKPMGDLNAKEYLFTYTEGQDFHNQDFKRNFGGNDNRLYGDKLLTVDNDFVTDTNETKLIFNPTPIVGKSVAYNQSDKVISTNYILNNDGTIKKTSGIKMLLYNVRGTDFEWNLSSIDPQTNPRLDVKWKVGDTRFRFYPQAIHLDNHLSPNFDLNFGVPTATYYTPEVYTENNLYKLFHQSFIEEITDRDSKIVTCHLYLKPTDIEMLEFSTLVLIDGHLLRLKKINDYAVNAKGLTQCEFIKVKTI